MLQAQARARSTSLAGWFGISSVCNILGAIKTAKLLDLGPERTS